MGLQTLLKGFLQTQTLYKQIKTDAINIRQKTEVVLRLHVILDVPLFFSLCLVRLVPDEPPGGVLLDEVSDEDVDDVEEDVTVFVLVSLLVVAVVDDEEGVEVVVVDEEEVVVVLVVVDEVDVVVVVAVKVCNSNTPGLFLTRTT